MRRRQFLNAGVLAAAGAATGARRAVAAAPPSAREFYQLRHYRLARGPQVKLVDDYFRAALVPALNRMGIARVGVFNVTVGPDMPAVYVLIPSAQAEGLVTLDDRLWQDAAYRKAGTPFLDAPAQEPAFQRVDVSLLGAFETVPAMRVPAEAGTTRPRLYELRTYKSPTEQFHRRKVEMFNAAEIALQTKMHMGAVFYGDTVAGVDMPNLRYMLRFDSLADRENKFRAFQDTAEWKALSDDPRYPSEIVATVTSVIMSPAPYSQI
jgi:hypothetical protein